MNGEIRQWASAALASGEIISMETGGEEAVTVSWPSDKYTPANARILAVKGEDASGNISQIWPQNTMTAYGIYISGVSYWSKLHVTVTRSQESIAN